MPAPGPVPCAPDDPLSRTTAPMILQTQTTRTSSCHDLHLWTSYVDPIISPSLDHVYKELFVWICLCETLAELLCWLLCQAVLSVVVCRSIDPYLLFDYVWTLHASWPGSCSWLQKNILADWNKVHEINISAEMTYVYVDIFLKMPYLITCCV